MDRRLDQLDRLIPVPESGQLAETFPGQDRLIPDRRKAKTVLACVIAWAFLLWPSLLNGAPFLMQDSTTYVRGADAVAYSLTGHRTEWTSELLRKFAPEGREPVAPAAGQLPRARRKGR